MEHAHAFVAAWAGWCPPSAAHGDLEPGVHGTLTTRVVPSASLSTESEWKGTLAGTSRFTLISLDEAHVPDAKISRFHGDLVLSTARGDLIGKDSGIWNLDTGNYFDVYTVTAGTGAFEGATAVIFLWGTLDAATGEGLSQYQGAVIGGQRR